MKTYFPIILSLSFFLILGYSGIAQVDETAIDHLINSGEPQTSYKRIGVQNWTIGNDNGDFKFSQGNNINTGELMILSEEGNVGIGTFPSQKLHIDGAGSKLVVGGALGTLGKLTVNAEPGVEVFRFRIDNATQFILDENGNLGLGTASQTAKFEINHDSDLDDPHLELTESTTDFARIKYRNSTNSSNYFDLAGNPGNTDPEFNIFYADAQGGANILSVDGDDRKVGINNTSPSGFLDVQGLASSSSPIVYAESNFSGSVDVRAVQGYSVPNDGYGYGGYFTGGYRGVYGFADGGSYSGSIIGVYGAASGSGTTYGVYGSTNSGSRRYGVYAAGDMKCSSKLFVGTTTTMEDAGSAFELLVDGEGLFEEVKVKTSGAWPDYVFQEDYSLMSLPQLDNYIRINGHLPGIPSAEEIAQEEGFFIGNMHTLQMEKIEELTLHLIDLNKKNNTLEKQNQELQKEVEELKAQMQLILQLLEE
jgi:hypothetical protein